MRTAGLRAVGRIVIGAAFLLVLGSCDLLFNGVFPGSVAQATARRDLSGRIAANPASFFQLSTVSAGGSEYVILFTSSNSFSSAETHLVIMDASLKVLNSYTMDELIAFPPVGLVSGNFAMTDCLDQVVIGNIWFTPSPGGFVFSQKNSGVFLNGPSVRGGPQFNFNETNFDISSGSLLYVEYSTAWAPTATMGTGVPLGVPSPPPPAGSFFSLINVLTDTTSASTPDVLIFQADGPSSQTYFMRVPKVVIDGDIGQGYALPSGQPDIFSYAAASLPPLVVKTNLDRNSIGFSAGGVTAYDQKDRALVRFTLEEPDKVSSLSINWVNGMKAAAAVSGTYCVVWDAASRTLTRYERWW